MRVARGFRRKGRGDRARYIAQLDLVERHLVVTMLGQVVGLLDPDGSISEARDARATRDRSTESTFDQIVAGLDASPGGAPGGAPVEPAGDGSDEQEPVAGMRGWPDARPDQDDPAVARLLPPGNVADADAAAEFRRFTEDSLRRRKVEGLHRAMEVLGGPDDKLELRRGDALAVLVALTDVRLVIASRLGLETDEDAERLHEVALRDDTDDQSAQGAAVYDFLTWLQESLSVCLTP